MQPCISIAVILLAASLVAADDPGDKKSEVKWAKGMAVDFVKAVSAGKGNQGLQLLTPKLETRRPDMDPPFVADESPHKSRSGR